jgi:hypothetical protein
LAGIAVRDDPVLELVILVDEPELATGLEDCFSREAEVITLDIAQRETWWRLPGTSARP